MLFKRSTIVGLLAAVAIEIEFVPNAEIERTAQYLRSVGISSVIDQENEKIIITPKSYKATMRRLVPIVPHLPDVYKMSWKAGETEATLFENLELPAANEVFTTAAFCKRLFLN